MTRPETLSACTQLQRRLEIADEPAQAISPGYPWFLSAIGWHVYSTQSEPGTSERVYASFIAENEHGLSSSYLQRSINKYME